MKKKILLVLAIITLVFMVGACSTSTMESRPSASLVANNVDANKERLVITEEILTPAIAIPVETWVGLRGTEDRMDVISEIIRAYYFPKAEFKRDPKKDSGEMLVVSGPGGTREILISEELKKKLEKEIANPGSNKGLKDLLCVKQKTRLDEAMGPISGQPVVAPVREAVTPAVVVKEVPVQASCPPCNPKNPNGNYTALKPFQGVAVVKNSSNGRFPNDSISAKVEYHDGWAPRIVVRNTNDPEALLRAYGAKMADYAKRVAALKAGQSGQEGETCYEVTLVKDGSVWNDSSPPEARW